MPDARRRVIMDNLSVHKGPGVVKRSKRPERPCGSAAARTFDALGEVTDAALAAATLQDCRGFFGNSGYVAL